MNLLDFLYNVRRKVKKWLARMVYAGGHKIQERPEPSAEDSRKIKIWNWLSQYCFKLVCETQGRSQLSIDDIRKAFGENYPPSLMLETENSEEQIAKLMEQIGCGAQYDIEENIVYDPLEVRIVLIKNYMAKKELDILDKIIAECKSSSGRIRYTQLMILFGFSPMERKNKNWKESLLLFVKELGLPHRYDEEYVYFV